MESVKMTLSAEATKVLKILKKQEKKFKKDKKNNETAKMSYFNIKEELFPENSYIKVSMLLKYLLEERYIYNHIEDKESEIRTRDLETNNVYLVIGEKGINYLNKRYFTLIAKTLPLLFSLISLIISIINLLV